MIASKPAILSSGPQYPPASDSPKPPVSGERAIALKRVAVDTGAPVSRPAASTSTLSGPSGSAPAGMSRRRWYAARALPPGYRR